MRSIMLLLAFAVLATVASAQPSTCTFSGGPFYKGDATIDYSIRFRVQTLSGYVNGTFVTSSDVTYAPDSITGVVSFSRVRGASIIVEAARHPSFSRPVTLTVPDQATYDLTLIALLNIANATPTGGLTITNGALNFRSGTLNITGSSVTVTESPANQANITFNGSTWGNITGTLSNQTDLQAALNAKQNTLTLGNLSGSGGVSVSGGSGAVIGSGVALSLSSVPNSALQNSAVTINGTSNRLTGGGAVSLGGSLTLNLDTTLLPSPVLGDVGKFLKATAANAYTPTTIAESDVSGLVSDLAAKEPTVAKGNLTEATSNVLTITGGTGAVIGSGASIQVKQSSGSQSGYLSSTDWATFNGKQAAGSYITALTGDVTASGPGSVAATIGAGKVTNAMLAGSIAYSKLSLTGAILNADLAGSIADSKLSTIATAGKVSDSALSSNVALLNRDPQTFTGTSNIFQQVGFQGTTPTANNPIKLTQTGIDQTVFGGPSYEAVRLQVSGGSNGGGAGQHLSAFLATVTATSNMPSTGGPVVINAQGVVNSGVVSDQLQMLNVNAFISGTANSAWSTYDQIVVLSGGQTTVATTGSHHDLVAIGTGVLANPTLFHGQIRSLSSGVISGTAKGIDLSNWSGSPTTSYGIYMDSSIDIGATRFALYSLSTSPSLLTGNLTVSGLLKLGSSPTTINDSAGKILSAALNTVGIGQGGTGLTGTPSNGQLPIGNGSGYTLGTLTAGAGLSVTNGSGSITVASTGEIKLAEVSGVSLASISPVNIYTVPSGKIDVIIRVLVVNQTGDASDGNYGFGFDVSGINLGSGFVGPNTGEAMNIPFDQSVSGLPSPYGVATNVFKIATTSTPTDITATAKVIVFGYRY